MVIGPGFQQWKLKACPLAPTTVANETLGEGEQIRPRTYREHCQEKLSSHQSVAQNIFAAKFAPPSGGYRHGQAEFGGDGQCNLMQ